MSPVHPLPPEQTPEERAKRLADARARRAELGDLRRRLRAQQLTLADVFAMVDDPSSNGDRPPVAARARIRQILLAVHGIGPGRADRILTDLSISADRRLSTLSPQQRQSILTTVNELTTRPPGAR